VPFELGILGLSFLQTFLEIFQVSLSLKAMARLAVGTGPDNSISELIFLLRVES
jgi:hypothetical protein